MAKISKQAVVRSYLERFPTAATMTLAKKIYKENSSLWSTLEACRTSVRYARGNKGKQGRQEAADKRFFRPNGVSGTGFDVLPEGMRDIDDFTPFVVNKPGTYLVLSDIHCPYHDKAALQAALESEPDCVGIILNGDTIDHYSLSRWEIDPRKRKFALELETSVSLLTTIRRCRPNVQIILKLGNHEERYERYMFLKAPELLDVPAFDFASLYKCDELEIEVVRDMRPIRLGKLNVIHGHEYKFSISNPVNPARGLFLRSKALALCGHFHQSSHHSENTLDDKRLVTYSTGCLCDLHPRYMPLNKWNHGFAAVHIDTDGAFNVENRRIIDGKIWN